MRTELKEGVALTVIPTKQFKTTRITINLITALTATKLAKRLLLGALLECGCQKYPDQKAIADELARMYGAGFEISSVRRGNLHFLSVSFDCVNDEFLAEKEDLLQAGFSFLQEILFRPLVSQKPAAFAAEFARQKKNVVDYAGATQDNKQLYADLSLQKLLFDDEKQALPSFGNYQELLKITASQLSSSYQECLNKDRIEIIVSGDVKEERCRQLAQQLPFAARNLRKEEIFYVQEGHALRKKEEKQKVTQGKLNLGFSLPVFFADPLYFTVLVFEGLFGGLPLSKLFVNVREKAQLAYYASSSYDSFRGVMTVRTGLDPKNKEQALAIIEAQLKDVQAGRVTQQEIEDTKKSLINEYLSGLDSQVNVMQRVLIAILTGRTLSTTSWITGIQNVTLAQIQAAAKMTKLQAVYFLDKE
ncbi:EF-P 5-aminopentanol modification-associated protein YfmF [Liquorilactobacillus satsumensis]|uniref:EF-P 5-aminopentanol modification-associated protein YfmF n=1 Tax=Liquorilactobacillus satsumensis TaxID=259059 RepID=UPI0039EB535C